MLDESCRFLSVISFGAEKWAAREDRMEAAVGQPVQRESTVSLGRSRMYRHSFHFVSFAHIESNTWYV